MSGPEEKSSEEQTAAQNRGAGWIWPVVKWSLFAVVAFFVARHAETLAGELSRRPAQVRWPFVAWAALVAAGAWTPSVLYWWRLVGRAGYPVPLATIVHAYWAGHIGKYVPGKAVAIAVRCTILKEVGVPLGVSARTAVQETLVSMLLGLARPIREAVGGPICCTLQGEDLFLEGLREPFRRQALALIREHAESVDAFLAVSTFYADFMADYLSIPREKIHVVPLGINLQDYEGQAEAGRRPLTDRPWTIGYFARIAPEKGLHLLVEAYCRLRERADFPPARLLAAGYLAPEHRGYLQAQEARLAEAGLADEFTYQGALDRDAKLRFFREIDLLSMPTTYAEPKGLPVLEAMASGVPVVQPRWGAFPEILERTGGGVLFEPNDVGSLVKALLELSLNPELARDLGRAGWAGVRAHYPVAQMATRAVDLYASLS